jgi:Fic family protein
MTDILYKKVMTLKSGNFVFSRKFSYRTISPLIVEAQILYETVNDLPILPEMASILKKDLIRRSIFGTAAIEGNPLPEEKVGQIISDADEKFSEEKAEQEIKNLIRAYAVIDSIKPSDEPPIVNEEFIRDIHEDITRNIRYPENEPGVYRNTKRQVGDKDHGGMYIPPKCLPDIQNLMKEFIEWINGDELRKSEILVRAALTHYYLGLIHPFGDGNGRTARLAEAAILTYGGIKYVPVMLSNYYYQNIDDYYWAYSKSIKNKKHDVTPFIEFVFKGMISSLREIKEGITYFIRIFALRDYYSYLRERRFLTQRQHDLLGTLLNTDVGFTLKDLFSKMPFQILYRNVTERTARNDLKKLTERFYLLRDENNVYSLNIKALEDVHEKEQER